MEFQDTHGRSVPRDAYYGEIADLIITIRAARAAWETGTAQRGEWHAFATQLRAALRAGTSLPVLTADVASWAAGWWRRAHFVNEKWR